MRHIGPAMMTVLFACILLIGCATSSGRQDNRSMPEPPEQETESTPTPTTTPPEDSSRSDGTMDIEFQFSIPPGWSAKQQPNKTVLFHHAKTESNIILSTWHPSKGGSPQDYIGEMWAQAALEAESNHDIEVNNMPMNMVVGSKSISAFSITRIIRGEGSEVDVRVTQLLVGFESNLPEKNVLMDGIWAEMLDAQMYGDFEIIASSVKLSRFDAGDTDESSLSPPNPEVFSAMFRSLKLQSVISRLTRARTTFPRTTSISNRTLLMDPWN